MSVAHDPATWEGDGFDALHEDEEPLELLHDALSFLPCELDALYECAKREGWVNEKLAAHLSKEGMTQGSRDKARAYLNISRYWWRRAARFKALAAELRERPDQEED